MAPKAYTARTELIVRMGEEYVYQPTAGGAGAARRRTCRAVVNCGNAADRFGRGGARARSRAVGFAALYPDIAAAPGSDARKLAAAERAFAQHLTVETAPQTPSIGLSFEHRNPEIAAQALNALVAQYLEHRRTVLVGGEFEALSQESADLERARGAREHGARGVPHRTPDRRLRKRTRRARRARGRHRNAIARRASAPPRSRSARRCAAARAIRPSRSRSSSTRNPTRAAIWCRRRWSASNCSSRYQPDALPVREVDRRIAQLEAFLAGGDPPSVTRRGANPVRQDVASQLYAMEAEARAQRGRETALTQQRTEVRDRLRAMQALEPRFRQLQRERSDPRNQRAEFRDARRRSARAQPDARAAPPTISAPVEQAAVPTQGKSLRWPIMIVTLLIAGVVAVGSRAFARA